MFRFAILTSLFCCTINLLPTAPAAAQQPAVEPGRIDVGISRVHAHVGARGLGHEHAVEGKVALGVIRLGVARDAGQIVFDMNSFVCDTAEARRYFGVQGTTDVDTRRQTRDNMIGPSVLDVAKFPTATFTIQSSLPVAKLQPTDPDMFDLSGEFTMHGVKRPLAIRVVSEGAPGVLRLRGGFTIKQTDFGITPFSKALGAVGVANEVKIYGDISIAAP